MKREEKFRKKPVIIDAFQFTDESKDAVYRWASSHQMNIQPSFDDYKAPILLIPTLEGEMICRMGDWIIRGVNGEFYPCKPDIFEKTYDLATPLPPAEGAKKVQWSGYGELGNISQKPLRPTAEGAEEFLRRHNISRHDFVYTTGFENMAGLLEEFATQARPILGNVDETLKANGISVDFDGNDYMKYGCTLNKIRKSMQEFAALHAQKIADKIVGERIREELIAYDRWVYDNNHYADNADEHAELVVNEYLKSRDSHE